MKALSECSPEQICQQLRSYQQERKHRDRDKLFYIEGTRNFLQAHDQAYRFHTVVISKKLLVVPAAQKVVRKLKHQQVPVVSVSPETFRQLGILERASGIAALVHQPQHDLQACKPAAGAYWVVLSQIRSSGNVGTLIRSAEAAGAAGFILLSQAVDPFDTHLIRASMGAYFHQPFIRATAAELADWIQQHQALVIGADPEAEQAYYQLQQTQRPILLMLGEERKGLSPDQRQLCNLMVKIPMQGQADSLNVSVAGSLLLYECWRIQHQTGD